MEKIKEKNGSIHRDGFHLAVFMEKEKHTFKIGEHSVARNQHNSYKIKGAINE